MKDNQFWRFQNSAGDSSEATLYIYGDIMQYDLGWWNWPDDVIPNRFKDELNALDDVSTIHVRINSAGGSVFGAYAIMNLLKNHKAQIITYNDGIAASAATLIAMSGNKIVSALGAMWMLHLPEVGARGNVNDLQKAIDILNMIKETMIDVYHAKTGIAKTELERMVNEDTWMTGTKAKEIGFADEVTDLQEVVAYLGEDKATASFNGLNISLANVRNKETLIGMLSSRPQTHQAPLAGQMEMTGQETDPSSQASQSSQTEEVEKFAKAVLDRLPGALQVPAAMINNLNQSTEQTTKGDEAVMNLADLRANHPDIYAEAFAAGVAEERARIQAIDEMALAGMEELTSEAKFTTGITAGEFAVALVKAQKTKGETFLNNAQTDAKEADGVPAAEEPPDSDDQETQALLKDLEARAETLK